MQRLTFLIEAGGPVIVLLILLSVMSLTIALIKLWQFMRLRVFDRQFVNPAINLWLRGRHDEAIAMVDGHPSPVARVIEQAMNTRGQSHEARTAEVTRIANDEMESLRAFLRPLEVIAYLSPLLGLLGTVIGMIRAFRELEAAGSRIDPSLLSGGIWEALLTTAAGLIVAIPAVILLQWFDRNIERIGHRMRDAATRLLYADGG